MYTKFLRSYLHHIFYYSENTGIIYIWYWYYIWQLTTYHSSGSSTFLWNTVWLSVIPSSSWGHTQRHRRSNTEHYTSNNTFYQKWTLYIIYSNTTEHTFNALVWCRYMYILQWEETHNNKVHWETNVYNFCPNILTVMHMHDVYK